MFRKDDLSDLNRNLQIVAQTRNPPKGLIVDRFTGGKTFIVIGLYPTNEFSKVHIYDHDGTIILTGEVIGQLGQFGSIVAAIRTTDLSPLPGFFAEVSHPNLLMHPFIREPSTKLSGHMLHNGFSYFFLCSRRRTFNFVFRSEEEHKYPEQQHRNRKIVVFNSQKKPIGIATLPEDYLLTNDASYFEIDSSSIVPLNPKTGYLKNIGSSIRSLDILKIKPGHCIYKMVYGENSEPVLEKYSNIVLTVAVTIDVVGLKGHENQPVVVIKDKQIELAYGYIIKSDIKNSFCKVLFFSDLRHRW